VLILSSRQDGLVHVNCSLAIASRWKCPLQLHPTAGHDLVLDDPDWVIKEVQRWLGKK
jgi:pimeloyl-ACP methyl ester carboxylesterase